MSTKAFHNSLIATVVRDFQSTPSERLDYRKVPAPASLQPRVNRLALESHDTESALMDTTERLFLDEPL